MSEQTAKAGRLLMVDNGSYSDYEVMGMFVVLSDFDLDVVSKEYLETYPDQSEQYEFDRYKFLSFIIKKGLLLEIDYANLYLSDYRDMEDIKLTP